EEIVAGRHLLAQISPAGWLDNYHRRRLDAGNPVIFGPARRATAFRWSDPGFADLTNWRGLALARESGVADGLAVPCHGPGRR
ncbi:autoinducer binding domain-containing protein, partial [Klebsiella pneumoniae]|uniref:autoinducer binding domain-containing protein n=1 Tax=Klebsiella pneumoniae TaxID=573 RepID=UPI0019543032